MKYIHKEAFLGLNPGKSQTGGKSEKEMKMIHRGQKGFTLIELLVVIAILGVIAAVVALNVGNFFGRGTLQAANTELHQAQTAIIAVMADGETGLLTLPSGNSSDFWSGEYGTVQVTVGNDTFDASEYIYGPFRATYEVNGYGEILSGTCNDTGQWGNGITWNPDVKSWEAA